ncbi:MAG TPA: HAMP domain-containing sensor histidine kinase [Gemmatimonadales bacterium]|nr:HAMP domain-containing sensor histidine kinase [Gemmatimonadales bacterium]
MRRDEVRRFAPILIVALVVLLSGLGAGAALIVVRHFQQDAKSISVLFSGVFAGLNDPRPGAEAGALLRLGEHVKSQGVPLVVTDRTGQVTAAANLPFDAPLDDPRVQRYAEMLDLDNPPIVDSVVGTVHYGPVPAKRQLTALAVLEGLTVLGIVGVAYLAYRNAMAAQRDRLWVAMAREAAHQMGTPLTSLQGWIEQLRSRPGDVPGLPDHLAADAERLERVAQRFERIGHTVKREPIALGALANKVAAYFRPRLPRHANPIELRVDSEQNGPVVLGDGILLEWALESLIKNAIDALQGQRGSITLRTGVEEAFATLRVLDDGPGVARELRSSIFDAGTSTKTGGWGIGLALVRRVVEDSHGGDLSLETTDRGASFLIRIPLHGNGRQD